MRWPEGEGVCFGRSEEQEYAPGHGSHDMEGTIPRASVVCPTLGGASSARDDIGPRMAKLDSPDPACLRATTCRHVRGLSSIQLMWVGTVSETKSRHSLEPRF